MAMRRGSTRALRTASAGLEWGKACPLMLFQQSAEFGVLRSEGSLCVIHTAMVVLALTVLQPPVRQAARGIESRAEIGLMLRPYVGYWPPNPIS